MDEYVGIPKDHPKAIIRSWQTTSANIDIKPETLSILNGNAPDLCKECAD